LSDLDRPWPWALDAAHRRYHVGDVVVTGKASWFGPGIRGEVTEITMGMVTLRTELSAAPQLRVRPYHVLVQERRTGVRVQVRKLWRKVNERMNGETPH